LVRAEHVGGEALLELDREGYVTLSFSEKYGTRHVVFTGYVPGSAHYEQPPPGVGDATLWFMDKVISEATAEYCQEARSADRVEFVATLMPGGKEVHKSLLLWDETDPP